MNKLICSSLFIVIACATSCVTVEAPHDNGRHAGWYKNPNNPHHPASTNPGHTKAPAKGKAKPGK